MGAPAAASAPSARLQAWERFCQQVREAGLRPGQFLSQRELMQRLGLTLGAVRELIPRLEAGGLLCTVPKRGLHLAPVSPRRVRDAFQVRTMIEREAIRHFVRLAADDELATLQARHRALLERACRRGPDPTLDADAQALDWGLHDRMVDSMDNALLSEIYRVNSLHVRLLGLDAADVASRRVRPAMEEHLVFLAALRARDEAAAAAALTEHIERSRRRVLDGARPGD
jgi:DNA-binding GntR family transcriptional regulator